MQSTNQLKFKSHISIVSIANQRRCTFLYNSNYILNFMNLLVSRGRRVDVDIDESCEARGVA